MTFAVASACTRAPVARWIVTALALAFALVAVAPGARAAEGVRAVEEVVVTARKRSESLEDIPVSMNAFNEDDIDSAGIETPADAIALTPNVTLVQTQNAGNSFINIRGVSQARNSEMSAAVLVDGVLLSNPAQFNQQLYDIEQIEILRGPQGALYGRNAIGGAITITTKQPTDEYEARVELGGDDGPGYELRGSVSGPVGNPDTLKFRASVSRVDTDGWIKNTTLNEEADPYEDTSGRLKLLWEPTDTFSADFRTSFSQLETQALYFNIVQEADDTSLPVQVNNAGFNERKMSSTSLKLDFDFTGGTLTTITAYDYVEEILTGDQFDFLPREQSFLNLDTSGFGGLIRTLTGSPVVDLSQTQYLEVESWSQEIRFTSPAENRLRYIVGAYAIATDRFISTGNQVDLGNGVFPVYDNPRPSVFVVGGADPSPQVGLLVDGQDNFAYALFGEVAYDINDRTELSFSLRYDWDEREQTTLTEPLYDPTGIGLVTGAKRKENWDDLQPKVTLTYQPNDDTTIYGGYSRGFRSGGFNQSGVGAAVPEPGVDDLFDEQTADTFEVGIKGRYFDGLLSSSLSVYHTLFEGTYFFFFDAATSTQNLGNIDEVTYTGLEFEASAALTDWVSMNLGVGITDSEIDKAADPLDEGNEAPLVSEYTINLGLQYRRPLALAARFGNVEFIARADYQRIGDTYWEPSNVSKRSDIDLLDVRAGFEVMDDWSLVIWSRNALDEEYNAEFSPGPAPEFATNFVFKGAPQRWGVQFTKRF